MKRLVQILFVFLIFLTSCYTSPEQKIKHDIKFQGRMRLKIENVQITDTLHVTQVKDALDQIPLRKQFYQDMLKDSRKIIDSMRHSGMKDHSSDSLMHEAFRKLMYYDRKMDEAEIQSTYYEELYDNYDDGICGYFAKVITHNKDTFDFVVSRDYKIVCPKFMLE